MIPRCHLLLFTSAAALLACTAWSGAAPPPPKTSSAQRLAGSQEEFFETKVRPLLVKRCGTCHSAAKASGGLSLATRAAVLKGGAHGPALAVGKPDESLLVRAVSFAEPALKMPPGGRLADAEIDTLREWVRSGAVWPDSAAVKAEGPLWSLQPVRVPTLPRVKNKIWVRNPIDAFILAKLEARGWRPAPPAGPRELIRRAAFDLTGLPPTPEEVDAFVNECEAGRASGAGGRGRQGAADRAYERLIDRLLASPHYGERWARYWLDLVRYADSNGYERDAEKPYSWKYRDYVINSLNEDKPYDRFVTEQVAGDELPDRSEATVTATGFLRLGTWDDEPNDPVDYQYERLDDLVHTTTTAFLGLTVRCARCHDHKFDPIPQKDYYAIGAAFWPGYLQAGDGKLMGGPPQERLGYQVLGFTDRGREAPPLHLLQGGDSKREGPVVEPGFLTSVPELKRPLEPPPAGAGTTHRRLQLAQWITDPGNPLTPRVLVNRLWQHHFGQGLVRTPNNFGRKGSAPTHPELVDWLAAAFYRADGETERAGDGGQAGSGVSPSLHPSVSPSAPLYGCGRSLKKLHRLMMLSSTYRMSSVHPLQAAYERRDYANELWWRSNRQRLDADALRDAMLAVSGQLNPAMGGRGFTPAVDRAALEGLSRKGAEWAVSPPEEQRRRSIYMFLKRALIAPFMTVFDFADTTQPLEQRDTSVVAPQALALMNNRFSHEQSDALARRVRKEAGPEAGRQVERLWRLAFGRSPDRTERAAALRHLQEVSSEPPPQSPAPAAAKEPDSLPQLRLWLRADRGVSTDEQGRVTGWSDLSLNGHHAAQPDPATRPELAVDGIGGRPSLRFDGKGRFLRLQGRPLTSPHFTIVAVVTDRTGEGSHREIFSNWTRERNIFSAVYLGATGAGTVRFTDNFAPAGTLARPDQPLALSAVTGPGGAAVYQDRSLLADRPSPLMDRKLDPPYVIGRQGNIQGEYWNGDIAEILVYDRALTRAELEGLWAYLSARYGVAKLPEPLPAADRALASLCHAVLNTNEFIYVD